MKVCFIIRKCAGKLKFYHRDVLEQTHHISILTIKCDQLKIIFIPFFNQISALPYTSLFKGFVIICVQSPTFRTLWIYLESKFLNAYFWLLLMFRTFFHYCSTICIVFRTFCIIFGPKSIFSEKIFLERVNFLVWSRESLLSIRYLRIVCVRIYWFKIYKF